MKNKMIVSALLSLTVSVHSAFASEVSVSSIQDAPVTVREVKGSDMGLFQERMDRLTKLNEEEMREQIIHQAMALDQAVIEARHSGVASLDDIEILELMAKSVWELSTKDHLKRRLIARKLMVVPRALAQGVGYLGMAMGDLIAAPIIFASKFGYNAASGDAVDGRVLLGIGGGLMGAGAVGIGEAIILGYSFPIYIGTVLPIQLTVSMVCEDYEIKSAHTRKFCNNYDKNGELLDKIGDAGEKAGDAVHEWIRHPLKSLRVKK